MAQPLEPDTIQSIKPFTPSALKELEFWLEPWFRNKQKPGLAFPPIRLGGAVLGGGSFAVGGSKQMICMGGHAIIVERDLSAGDLITVDYGFIPTLDELGAKLYHVTGWDPATSDDGLGLNFSRPWTRTPWTSQAGLGDASLVTPFDYDISPGVFEGAVGMSVGVAVSADTITWTAPVAEVEQGSIDTTHGHWGFLFHDFGPNVVTSFHHMTVTHTGTAQGCYAYFNRYHRRGSESVYVNPTPLVSGTASPATENIVELVLPSDISKGDFLMVTAAGERAQSRDNNINSSLVRPRIHYNWNHQDWAVPIDRGRD